jgi:hypothetical protein
MCLNGLVYTNSIKTNKGAGSTMQRTMKVKEALKYLEGLYVQAKSKLSDEQQHWMDCRQEDPTSAIIVAQSLIKTRFYCGDCDENDYTIYTNMLLLLDKHSQITKALKNGMIKNSTLVQIDITNC